MQLPNLGHGGEYRRRRRSISAHKLLVAVAIALAIAVTVRAVLLGDPGPSLGMPDDWSAPQRTTSVVIEAVPTVGERNAPPLRDQPVSEKPH